MEAVAALLRGLPLQPEESDRGDLMEAKSQLFLKWVQDFYTKYGNGSLVVVVQTCDNPMELGAAYVRDVGEG